MYRFKAAAFGLAATTVMVGCASDASAQLFVDPDSFAQMVATSVQQSTRSVELPTIDCGMENILVEQGDVVTCALVADDGALFDTSVTIYEVDGLNYSILTQVADEPR